MVQPACHLTMAGLTTKSSLCSSTSPSRQSTDPSKSRKSESRLKSWQFLIQKSIQALAVSYWICRKAIPHFPSRDVFLSKFPNYDYAVSPCPSGMKRCIRTCPIVIDKPTWVWSLQFVSSDRSSCIDNGLLYIRSGNFFGFSFSLSMQLMLQVTL